LLYRPSVVLPSTHSFIGEGRDTFIVAMEFTFTLVATPWQILAKIVSNWGKRGRLCGICGTL